MKWSWKAFLIYCCLLSALSLGGAWISGQLLESKKLVIAESEQVTLAMFLGSLGASLILSIVGAFRGWQLSHFLAAVAIVSGLFGGSVAAATVVVILAAIVSLAAAKIVQVFFFYFSASATSQDSDAELAETDERSETTKEAKSCEATGDNVPS